MPKFGPFKRKRDWRGKLVRLRRGAITGGGDTYPSDMIFEVTSTSNAQFGYHLRSTECDYCGHAGSIRLRKHHDMELVGAGPLEPSRERVIRERDDLRQRLAEAHAALSKQPLLRTKPALAEQFSADAHQLFCRNLDDVEVMIDALDDPDRRWFASEDLLTYLHFGHTFKFAPLTGSQLRRICESLGGHTSVRDPHAALVRLAVHRLELSRSIERNGVVNSARFFDSDHPYTSQRVWTVHGRLFVSEGAAEAYSSFRQALDKLPLPERVE